MSSNSDSPLRTLREPSKRVSISTTGKSTSEIAGYEELETQPSFLGLHGVNLCLSSSECGDRQDDEVDVPVAPSTPGPVSPISRPLDIIMNEYASSEAPMSSPGTGLPVYDDWEWSGENLGHIYEQSSPQGPLGEWTEEDERKLRAYHNEQGDWADMSEYAGSVAGEDEGRVDEGGCYDYPEEESQVVSPGYNARVKSEEADDSMEAGESGGQAGHDSSFEVPVADPSIGASRDAEEDAGEEEARILLLVDDSQNSPDAQQALRDFNEASSNLSPADRLALIRGIEEAARARVLRKAREVPVSRGIDSEDALGQSQVAWESSLREQVENSERAERERSCGLIFDHTTGDLRTNFQYRYAVGPEWEIEALVERTLPLRQATEPAARIQAELRGRREARMARANSREEFSEGIRLEWEAFLVYKVQELEVKIEEWKALAGDRKAFKRRAKHILALVDMMQQI
ncbi:hypothetical protein P7C70_g5342, partial [Phenoliferia sp. Uapishka_3]